MLDTLSSILVEAGAQALGFFDSRAARQVTAKAPLDLVSDADREVEATIRRLLARHFPGDGILGEELGGSATGRFWAVDPIDGTANFLSGLPFWAISLGLMDHGEPLAGGIFAPALGLMAVGEARGVLRETGLGPGSRATDPPCIGLGRNPRWPAADRHAVEAAVEAAGYAPPPLRFLRAVADAGRDRTAEGLHRTPRGRSLGLRRGPCALPRRGPVDRLRCPSRRHGGRAGRRGLRHH